MLRPPWALHDEVTDDDEIHGTRCRSRRRRKDLAVASKHGNAIKSKRRTGLFSVPQPPSADDFHIMDELFRSINGAVYKARRKLDRRIVVLKERRCAELGRRRDIMNEVKLLERLRHPNIIECLGSFWDSLRGALYVVLEYAAGGDLHALLQSRRVDSTPFYLPEDWIWLSLQQVCAGLLHLHERAIIHRDIKPLNILVSATDHLSRSTEVPMRLPTDPKLKLADFGVSRQISEMTTHLHTMYGTPLYASPELCEGRPYNEKTDIWSLGVVLYEMAALRPPFGGCNIFELAAAIRQGSFAPLPNCYSVALSRLLSACLNTQAESRPAVATVFDWFPGENHAETKIEDGGEEHSREEEIDMSQPASCGKRQSPPSDEPIQSNVPQSVRESANESSQTPAQNSAHEFAQESVENPASESENDPRTASTPTHAKTQHATSGKQKLVLNTRRLETKVKRKRLHLENVRAYAALHNTTPTERAENAALVKRAEDELRQVVDELRRVVTVLDDAAYEVPIRAIPLAWTEDGSALRATRSRHKKTVAEDQNDFIFMKTHRNAHKNFFKARQNRLNQRKDFIFGKAMNWMEPRSQERTGICPGNVAHTTTQGALADRRASGGSKLEGAQVSLRPSHRESPAMSGIFAEALRSKANLSSAKLVPTTPVPIDDCNNCRGQTQMKQDIQRPKTADLHRVHLSCPNSSCMPPAGKSSGASNRGRNRASLAYLRTRCGPDADADR